MSETAENLRGWAGYEREHPDQHPARGDQADLLTEAANLLDYYASVVEGLTSDGAVEAAAKAITPGVVGYGNNLQRAEFTLQAALQHAQSKAEPGSEDGDQPDYEQSVRETDDWGFQDGANNA